MCRNKTTVEKWNFHPLLQQPLLLTLPITGMRPSETCPKSNAALRLRKVLHPLLMEAHLTAPAAASLCGFSLYYHRAGWAGGCMEHVSEMSQHSDQRQVVVFFRIKDPSGNIISCKAVTYAFLLSGIHTLIELAHYPNE